MAKSFCFRLAMCLPHFCVSIVSILRSAALFLLAHETVFMIQRALPLPLLHCRFCPGPVSSCGISFCTRKRSTGCWPLFYSPTAVKDSDGICNVTTSQSGAGDWNFARDMQTLQMQFSYIGTKEALQGFWNGILQFPWT